MKINESNQNREPKESIKTRSKKYLRNLIDFSHLDKKTILYVVIFLILVIFSVFLLYYNYFVDDTFIYTLIADWFVNPIFDLGFIGIFLFILIMAVQGLLVPIPSEVVLLATGMIWGWFLGGIMGVIGSMAAAVLCFYVSRRGGRPLAERFIGEKGINMADDLIQKYGTKAIIVSRLIPFISFDVISYASGLVDIKFKKYINGTLIGSIFRAFFYSVWGDFLGFTPPIDTTDVALIKAQAGVFNWVLLVVLSVLVLMFIAYYFTARHYEKKRKEKEISKL
ncbi:MAG: TVP38/TMEM64 family protein [Promethearchaeota archaeon]|jgi:uncharacterized membrane protein YdjX (TVP38/TMEM64 family)